MEKDIIQELKNAGYDAEYIWGSLVINAGREKAFDGPTREEIRHILEENGFTEWRRRLPEFISVQSSQTEIHDETEKKIMNTANPVRRRYYGIIQKRN